MVDKTSKTTEYKYTNLDEIQANKIVNVFGVVKFARPPTKTRGSGINKTLPLVHVFVKSYDCPVFI